jgi:hypothetical protein
MARPVGYQEYPREEVELTPVVRNRGGKQLNLKRRGAKQGDKGSSTEFTEWKGLVVFKSRLQADKARDAAWEASSGEWESQGQGLSWIRSI